MEALDRGGRLAVAGIYLSDIPSINYGTHLFQERELVSVTADTRRDGAEFLALAARDPHPCDDDRVPIREGRRGHRGPGTRRGERGRRDQGRRVTSR